MPKASFYNSAEIYCKLFNKNIIPIRKERQKSHKQIKLKPLLKGNGAEAVKSHRLIIKSIISVQLHALKAITVICHQLLL